MAQKQRKSRKKRGSRSCGYGSAQKHRGAGSRGGRGKAGSSKHKQIKSLIEGRVFGKVGFKRHPSLSSKAKGINLSDISERIDGWVEDGKAKKTAKGYSVDLSDLGYGKVLGGGELTQKMEIKAGSFSKSAKEKIEKAGGKAIEGDGVDTV